MSMRGLKRRTWIIVLLLVGVTAAVVRYRSSGDQDLQYEIAKVDRGRIVARVTATGTLSALVTVQVGTQVSGRIQRIYVDFNSPVTQGQLIAKIDPALFEASVAQAQANVAAADGTLAKDRAQAVNADLQLKRENELAERKLVAPADRDTAVATANAARAQVEADKGALEQAKAALHQSQVNLDYTNIVSPTNGVVIARNVDVGQTVAASLQAPVLFLIAEDLAKMQVDTSVAEADIGKLSPGMTATFTVDAYLGERFTGTVRQIRKNPQTVQNVVTYDAVIDVKNPDLKLLPGMTANATFVYAEKDDVMRASNVALRFRPTPALVALARQSVADTADGHGGLQSARAEDRSARHSGAKTKHDEDDPTRRTLWVLRDDKPMSISVQVGISDGTFTEIVSGDLKPGDELITDVSSGETPRTAPVGGMGGPGGPGGGFRRMF